jgi:hypothetical protein
MEWTAPIAVVRSEHIALCFRHGRLENARGTAPGARTDGGSYHRTRTLGVRTWQAPRASSGVDEGGIRTKAAGPATRQQEQTRIRLKLPGHPCGEVFHGLEAGLGGWQRCASSCCSSSVVAKSASIRAISRTSLEIAGTPACSLLA